MPSPTLSPIRAIPAINNYWLRVCIGAGVAGFAPTAVGAWTRTGAWHPYCALVMLAAWFAALLLTDKYRHKYPQRYDTYLAASHLKAAAIMAVVVGVMAPVVAKHGEPASVMWTGLLAFILTDYLVSLPRRRSHAPVRSHDAFSASLAGTSHKPGSSNGASSALPDVVVDAALLSGLADQLGEPLLSFLRQHVPNARGHASVVRVIDDVGSARPEAAVENVATVIGSSRLNDVRRLNLYL